MNKVNYDDYFLTLAYLVAQRSPDPSSKCGAVLVAKDRRILSTGYNGPIRGSDDDRVPLTRPEKYPHMLHGEENCILAYNGSAYDLEDSTIYVTGQPCHKCLRMIIQKGIRNIVYTDGNQTVLQDAAEKAICELMLSYSDKVTVRVVDNSREIVNLLERTQTYLKLKNVDKFAYSPVLDDLIDKK